MKITHDFHTHSVYSNDTGRSATFDLYLERARKMGITHLGYAEHFWDDSIDGAFPFYVPLNRERMMQAKQELESYKNNDVRLYFGCEAEYDPVHHAPAITEATAETFDFVLVPHSHSHGTMPKEYYDVPQKHCDFLVKAYNDIVNSSVSRYITGMAHPFSLVRCPYPCSVLIDLVSDDTFKRMFDRTAEKDIAIEINTSCVFKDSSFKTLETSPHLRIFRLAKECGCKFIFGSDSHSSHDLDILDQANALSEILSLTEKDIAPIAYEK